MCNCGRRRNELRQQSTVINKNIQNTSQQPVVKKEPVLFQYTGNTALTVTGSITRKNYRFNFSGDVQAIEFNDASAMIAIPVLKKII